jgi:hypothetical protein
MKHVEASLSFHLLSPLVPFQYTSLTIRNDEIERAVADRCIRRNALVIFEKNRTKPVPTRGTTKRQSAHFTAALGLESSLRAKGSGVSLDIDGVFGAIHLCECLRHAESSQRSSFNRRVSRSGEKADGSNEPIVQYLSTNNAIRVELAIVSR